MEILSRMRHKNVMKFFEHLDLNDPDQPELNHVLFITELCQGGDLL